MRKTTLVMCILAFLLSLAFLHSVSITYAQADSDTQTLSNDSSAFNAYLKNADENDSDRIAALSSLIVMYSEQLEEYDRSNGVFVVTCISFCGVVLGLAITLITKNKKIKRPNIALAAVFALLPMIMTLCLYVFSMQCRRVAFFRGYLSYLEENLSDLIGIPMVFDEYVVPEFFGKFHTNFFGPVAMILFIFVLFGTSIYLCWYFAKSALDPKKTNNNEDNESKVSNEKKAKCILIAVFVLCVIFCSVCTYDLVTNGGVPNEVYEYCKHIQSSSVAP